MQLVFATNNANKLKEVKALLPDNITLLSLKDINCLEDIPETQDTIEGNALQKAQYVKTHYGYNCFADDTGLEVNALDGAPGVYSARYAGPQKDAADNMQLLLDNLEGITNRSAHFKTVIALCLDNDIHEFTGICEGQITREKHGEQGFGYDPIFKPKGYDTTFAEMDLKEKNKIGHRGKATLQLLSFLNNFS